MNQPDNILNELREISPAVAGINRTNVFSVPEGYFESLSGLLLLKASAENALQKSLKATAVPEGYFDNLAGNILNRIKNEKSQETAGISDMVSGIGRNNVYAVPAGYFETLPDQILKAALRSNETVAAETVTISDIVAGIGNQNVYSLPAGYFDNLASATMKQVLAANESYEETSKISSLVAGIGNENIYQVPQGYFEDLSATVLQNIQPTAKVISMKGRFSAFKYAAAAVVTGIIAISTFFILNNNNTKPSSQVAVIKAANQIIKTNSFEQEMDNISDAAIVAFLEGKGQNVEASLVASLVDEKNLPEADEYLLNDNTLDEMLKTLDLNN